MGHLGQYKKSSKLYSRLLEKPDHGLYDIMIYMKKESKSSQNAILYERPGGELGYTTFSLNQESEQMQMSLEKLGYSILGVMSVVEARKQLNQSQKLNKIATQMNENPNIRR